MTDMRAATDVYAYAYDPARSPEYFNGVLTRRFFAFLIDATIVIGPIILLSIFIFVLGIVTLGLGWLLFWLLTPLFVIWALVYTGSTLGSPASATLGMRAMDLELRLWNGGRLNFLLGAVHAVFFWVITATLTPLIHLLALFNARRRLLQDFLTGTVLVNNERRAASLRRG
jgi:uncharacterized RDD family membrane protein YckC